MDVDTNNTQYSRIKECEVCSKNDAKYTCPRCELRTCCLECIIIHKKELDCNGLRDKVKFKPIKNFDNIDLLNDYRLLEETARVVNKSVKLPAMSCYGARSGMLPQDLYRLKCTAQARGIQLYFLPPSFNRHKKNTSFLDHKSQNLYWRVDWVFPQAGNISFTDEKVLDSTLLSACVHKYIVYEECVHPSLSFYQAVGHPGIKLLLKAERTAPNRYFLLDRTSTLRENLEGKSIIEYPVIHLILSEHIYMYNVFTEVEEHNIKKKQRRRQRPRNKNTTFNNNFLFSCKDGEGIESNEEVSSTEDTPDIEGKNDRNSTFKRHNNYQHRRGRRGNSFKNKWNLKHRTGVQHFPRKNANDFSEFTINGKLSNDLGSVNIESQ